MKIINNKFHAAGLAALSLGLLASCSDKDDYTPGGAEDGAQVYFAADQQSQYELKTDQGTYTISVYRVDDSETVSVPIKVTPLEGNTGNSAFNFPDAVAFNAGEKVSEFIIEFDLDKFVDENGETLFDNEQQFQFNIDENYTTKYGSTSVILTFLLPSPWESIGEGLYYDTAWGLRDGETEEEVYDIPSKVEFFVNGLNPNLYRITNPYEWLEDTKDAYFEFQVLQKGETFLNQTVPTTGLVGYDRFLIDYYPDFQYQDASYDANVYIAFPGLFSSLADPSNWVNNYVSDWQDDEKTLPGLIILNPLYLMSPPGAGYNYSSYGNIQIVFPGYNPIDASVEVTYNGILHKADESLEVVAYVKVGTDVSEAKVAIVSGSSPSGSDIEGIQNGSIESISLSSSGTVNLPFDSENPEGKYSIVAISYYDGEARNVDYATFSYTPATAETWSLVGEGTYTYLSFWEENLGIEPEVLELYESDATPGKFKIEHWLGDENFIFTVDEDGTIYVAEGQDTGITTGGVMITVDDGTLWDLEPGYLKDGVYNFSVVYYNPNSFGVYCYGVETFVPSTVAPASVSSRNLKLNSKKNKTINVSLKSRRNSSIQKKSGLTFETLL